jgi:hypothetical protein
LRAARGQLFKARSPRRLQGAAALALVAYALFSTATSFALFGPSTNPNRELFPFFTWSLFSDADDRKIEHGVLIEAVDGRVFNPPRDWREVKSLPLFGDSPSLGLKAVRHLGGRLRARDPAAERLRSVFESRYFGQLDVDYRIVRAVYDPMALWRDGAPPEATETVGRFSHRDGS